MLVLKRDIKRFEYKIRIQFNNTPLDIDKKNYVAKIENVYFVCDLDYWSRNRLNNFALKNCLFGATKIVRNGNKVINYIYSGYGIGFDGVGTWSFDNYFAGNVVIFGVGNHSSSHIIVIILF